MSRVSKKSRLRTGFYPPTLFSVISQAKIRSYPDFLYCPRVINKRQQYRKSQTRREAGTESHGSQLNEIAGLPETSIGDPTFMTPEEKE
jgi:hypothetical protein